jgi:hypothetical protein
MIGLNTPHLKIEVIRKLLEVIKEVPEYEIHEDHCGVLDYKECDCLMSKLRKIVEDTETYLDTGDASKILS